MAIRSLRIANPDKPPTGARTGHPSATARGFRGWAPPRPADPLAPRTNNEEARCAQCGCRLERLDAYAECPLCLSDNPGGY